MDSGRQLDFGERVLTVFRGGHAVARFLQADFENYRKRVEKEVGDSRRFGNERLLSELLVVNDELELALQRSKEAEQDSVLIEGVDMVHKRLQGLLSKEGVKKILKKNQIFIQTFLLIMMDLILNCIQYMF